jgi:predicted GH43/DUF377 family glycosyl hydrolase
MHQNPLSVRRLSVRLVGDPSRTIMRFFWIGDERARKIVARVLALGPDKTAEQLAATAERFEARNPDYEQILMLHWEEAQKRGSIRETFTKDQCLLIGAYFTLEYSVESAALFNPSIVPRIDGETGLKPGEARFLMSLRAVGEGHLSSVVFRDGTIRADGEIVIAPPVPHARQVRAVENRTYEKADFVRKAADVGLVNTISDAIFKSLGGPFTNEELRDAIAAARDRADDLRYFDPVAEKLEWLARSNYEIHIQDRGDPSRLVLFPLSESESQGIEDMRLVLFTDDDGARRYYGTYTAYDGRNILPQLLDIPKPGVAYVHTLHGSAARNKGMALFPRRVNGKYAMIGRMDGENMYYLESHSLLFWDHAEMLREPLHRWEFIQVGNCGAPIETEVGWLVLTHGVGPLRRYCMGAILLDLDNPRKIIGDLREPLLEPADDERTGYVPNVVYSCGGMVHNGMLIIPYGISDSATGFAVVPLAELLARLI